jgi:hypothetical protein
MIQTAAEYASKRDDPDERNAPRLLQRIQPTIDSTYVQQELQVRYE